MKQLGEWLRGLPVAIRVLLGAFAMSLPFSVLAVAITGIFMRGLAIFLALTAIWLVISGYTEIQARRGRQ
jgi:hypothetical protein